MKHWPFNVISDSGRPKVEVEYKGETKSFYPEEISSMVLVKMKEIAEAYLGKVSLSCIAVYFRFLLTVSLFIRNFFFSTLIFADCIKCGCNSASLL